MAHGLKTAEFRHLLNPTAQGGAKVEQIADREAGKPVGAPLIAKNRRNALLNLLSKVEQRLSKVEQQGGRCSTHRDTPKGVFPSGKWSSPPVRLLRWSNPHPLPAGER